MEYTIYELVKKLVGPINPIGESNADSKRFDHLKVLTELIDDLLTDIDNVAYENKDSHEFSVKRASEYASQFLDKIGLEK